MTSLLIITSVEELQEHINKTIKNYENIPGVYVSLNKSQNSIESIFLKNKISIKKIFFIDCVTSEQKKDEVLHIKPNELEKLSYSINSFIREIKGDKYLLIDAISTLLIYNDENKVASFVKEITEFANNKGVQIIAFSPKTKGEELLNKIFNFFDEVKNF